MASGKYLLDTNIVIAILAAEQGVLRRLHTADQFYLSVIVLGELYYGARHSARVDANLATIRSLATAMPILGCDSEVAFSYGGIKSELRRQGKPLPENDIWIAAIAHTHGLALVTRDRHFEDVASLRVVVW